MGEEAEAPEYKSKTFYDVIIKNGNFKGWITSWVGLGTMIFIHPEKKEFKTSFGSDEEWMEQCWNAFIEHANKK
jgi:hypothetical protein